MPTEVRRVERRLLALRLWVERISSRVWSSLPDMLAVDVRVGRVWVWWRESTGRSRAAINSSAMMLVGKSLGVD